MEVARAVHNMAGFEFIEHRYSLGDSGYLRFEIFDDVLFVHPVVTELSLSNFKKVKRELYDITRTIMDKYFYDTVFIYTSNDRLVRLYGKDIIHKVEDMEGSTLYYVEREDI